MTIRKLRFRLAKNFIIRLLYKDTLTSIPAFSLDFFSFFNVCDVFNVVFSMFVCYSAAFCQLCFYNKDKIGLDWKLQITACSLF